MRAAVISGGVVLNVLEVPDEWTTETMGLPEGQELVEVPDGVVVGPGMVWNGGEPTEGEGDPPAWEGVPEVPDENPTDPVTLASLAAKVADLEQRVEALEAL